MISKCNSCHSSLGTCYNLRIYNAQALDMLLKNTGMVETDFSALKSVNGFIVYLLLSRRKSVRDSYMIELTKFFSGMQIIFSP